MLIKMEFVTITRQEQIPGTEQISLTKTEMVFATTAGLPEKVKEIVMDAEWVIREVMETAVVEDLAISVVPDKVMEIAAVEGMDINTGTDKGIKVYSDSRINPGKLMTREA